MEFTRRGLFQSLLGIAAAIPAVAGGLKISRKCDWRFPPTHAADVRRNLPLYYPCGYSGRDYGVDGRPSPPTEDELACCSQDVSERWRMADVVMAAFPGYKITALFVHQDGSPVFDYRDPAYYAINTFDGVHLTVTIPEMAKWVEGARDTAALAVNISYLRVVSR